MTTIQTNPKYSHLSGFIESIPHVFSASGDTIHEGRNTIKVFTLPDATMLNVKRYHRPSGPNLLIYSSGIRKPKGLRAYNYPQILLSRGISTPEAVAYIEERRFGLLGFSYFVSIQCPYEHTLYDIGNAEEGTYETLAAEFARFTATIHEKQLMHLDYSPGNILYTRTPSGGYRFSLVDINRMYFGSVTMQKGLSNFKRLWGPKRFFKLMIREYAAARGFDEEEALAYAMEERRKFWTRYQKKHEVDFRLEL